MAGEAFTSTCGGGNRLGCGAPIEMRRVLVDGMPKWRAFEVAMGNPTNDEHWRVCSVAREQRLAKKRRQEAEERVPEHRHDWRVVGRAFLSTGDLGIRWRCVDKACGDTETLGNADLPGQRGQVVA